MNDLFFFSAHLFGSRFCCPHEGEMPFAGICESYLLRDDGIVLWFGLHCDDIRTLGDADGGITFKQVSAGRAHVLLLRTDGRLLCSRIDDCLQFVSPQLEAGVILLQVSLDLIIHYFCSMMAGWSPRVRIDMGNAAYPRQNLV